MLAVCRSRGWPAAGYSHADHPLQRELLEVVAEAAELPAKEVATVPDGCGVLTFGMALARMARAFGRIGELDGGERVVAAMRSFPELIGGEPSLDTRLIRALPGWIAKGGAEGLLTLRAPDGTGIALKNEDGAQRPLGPALAVFGRLLGHALDGFARVPVLDTNGRTVGEVSAR
jgi:L-asparaginase II